MSSDDIPKIPDRPQRVRGHRTTEVSDREKSPVPSSGKTDLAKAEGSELPKIPAHRPQRVKNSPPPPALPASRPHESSGEKPSVPDERPSREKKDERREDDGISKDEESQGFKESSNDETAPRLPAARPQRVRTTPALGTMPSTGPSAALKAVASTGDVERSEEHQDESIKRSTTENLDMLVQNTSQQLKEMEMLLSKRDAQVHGNSRSRPINAADVKLNNELVPDNQKQKNIDPNDGLKIEPQAASKPESNGEQSSAGENDEEQINRGSHQETEQSHSTAEEHPDELQALASTNQDEMKEAQPERELSPDEEAPTAQSTKAQVSADSVEEREAAKPTRDRTPVLEPDRPSDKVKETKEEDISSEAAPLVSKDIDVQSQKSEDSSIPSAKRAAPPVPKKPSSRIAAFQQMLQKQQLEQLQGSNPFRSHEPMESTRRTALSDERTQFGKNLGSLFANPDMTAGSPISTDKGTESSKLEGAVENKRVSSEPRQQRARGPRGRKLPSQVANVEKVKTESTNDIELFHMWKIISNNREDQEKEALEEDSGQKSAQLAEGSDTFEILSDGMQERRPSVLEDPNQPKIRSEETVSEIENLTPDEEPQRLLAQDAFDLQEVSQVSSTTNQEVEENPRETISVTPERNSTEREATDDKDAAGSSTDLEQEL